MPAVGHVPQLALAGQVGPSQEGPKVRTRAGCGTSGLQAALGGGGALALALLVGTACRE